MADIMSRIILQAQGGDQVAREVGKVTKAYKDAGQASKGMSARGGTAATDPFERAIQETFFSNTQNRQQQNQQYNDDVRQRETQHQSLATANNRAARGISAASSIASDDLAGGASQGLGMLAGAGVAGIVAMVAGAAIMGGQRLAEKESEREEQLGRGLMQGLGYTVGSGRGWEQNFRPVTTGLLQAGVPRDTLYSYLQGLKGAGAVFDETNAQAIGMTMLGQGIEGGTMAQWQAARQRAGVGATTDPQMSMDLYRGREAWGQGGLNRFVGTVTSAIEQAMTRGIEKGSETFSRGAEYTNFVRLLSGFSVIGGMTDVGAIQAFNQVQQAVVRSQEMAKPLDAFQFMAMRQPGESYGDTMRRMSAPGADLDYFLNLETQAGGRDEILEIMMRQQFGLDWQAIPGAIKTYRNQAAYRRGDFSAYTPGSAARVDEDILRTLRTEQQQLMEGVQNVARDVWNTVNEIIRGDYTPFNENQAQLRTSEKMATIYGGPGRGWTGPTGWGEAQRQYEEGETAGLGALGEALSGTHAGEAIIPQLLLYQYAQVKSNIMPENARSEVMELGPLFDYVQGLLQTEGGRSVMSTVAGQSQYMATLLDLDVSKKLDNLEGVYTIIEVLEAMEQTLGVDSLSDEGSTE